MHSIDCGYFKENINSSPKRSILLFGRCKLTIKFPRNHANRCFSSDYYFITFKIGIWNPRLWLCYSINLNRHIVNFVGYLLTANMNI